jgi:DNA-binding NtrC family response regulator
MFAIELLEGSAPPREEPAGVASDVQPLTLGVVDDNPQVLDALALALKAAGHAVFCGSSGKELWERLDGRIPDAIVSDYRLSETESGFDVIAAARAAFGSGLPAIIITGDTDPALLRTMRQRGIEILYKPVDMDALNASIRRHTQTDL